jgi:hypothetical protein
VRLEHVMPFASDMQMGIQLFDLVLRRSKDGRGHSKDVRLESCGLGRSITYVNVDDRVGL